MEVSNSNPSVSVLQVHICFRRAPDSLRSDLSFEFLGLGCWAQMSASCATHFSNYSQISPRLVQIAENHLLARAMKHRYHAPSQYQLSHVHSSLGALFEFVALEEDQALPSRLSVFAF